uniref:Uncharacterized protein n=1 Tax=Oryza barthii TaxID=65489 RepID=A0A0D3G7D0_9ORYZ
MAKEEENSKLTYLIMSSNTFHLIFGISMSLASFSWRTEVCQGQSNPPLHRFFSYSHHIKQLNGPGSLARKTTDRRGAVRCGEGSGWWGERLPFLASSARTWVARLAAARSAWRQEKHRWRASTCVRTSRASAAWEWRQQISGPAEPSSSSSLSGEGARRRLDLRGAAAVLMEVAAAAVADEAEVAAVVEARWLPDLRRAAAVLADEAAAFADEAEAATGADEAAALAEVALVEAEAVALAEVADGVVTPFARPRWDKFVRQGRDGDGSGSVVSLGGSGGLAAR